MLMDFWRHFETPNDQGGGPPGIESPPQPPAPPARTPAAPDTSMDERVRKLEAEINAEREARAKLLRGRTGELEQQLAQERVARARLQAANDFPKADQELLADLPFDNPDDILSYAKKLHEKALFREQWTGTGVPMPPTNQTDQALSQEQMQLRRYQTQVRDNNLRRQMDPVDRQMAFDMFFRNGWNAHMEARKRMAGTQTTLRTADQV